MKKTLLQIAGAEEKKIDWKNCNLLLIDMQKQYFTKELDLKKEGLKALNRAKKVLNLARSRSVNIFHVIHVASNKSVLFNSSSDNIQIMDEVKPNKNETIIKKTMPNSFFKTELYDLLSLTEKNNCV